MGWPPLRKPFFSHDFPLNPTSPSPRNFIKNERSPRREGKKWKTATAESSKLIVRTSLFLAARRLCTIVPAAPVETAVDDSTRQQRKPPPGIAPSKAHNQPNLCWSFHNPALVNVHEPCEYRSDYRSLQMRFCYLLTHVVAYNMLLTTGDIFFCQIDAKLRHDVVLLSAKTSRQRRFSGLLIVQRFKSTLQKIKGKEVN